MNDLPSRPITLLDAESLETEIKFAVPANRTAITLRMLEQLCDPDPKYPFGIISSIYYDSPNWDYLREKRDSDYLKTKVRLRWYEQTDADTETPDLSHMEIKYRIGSKRKKIRVPTIFSGKYLSNTELDDAKLLRMPSILATKGAPIRQPIFPAFIVRYCRNRFVDRSTGARLCLDYSICSPKSNSFMVGSPYPCMLQSSVLEIKGTDGELPLSLQALFKVGLRRESFSKYYECYAQLTRTFF
ncbi:MAG: VTC domain-containing protein [Gammaproteobacteria bacterium]|nr:VTC domain-containing protein [Gammaproteobacteria bacterium]